MFATFPHQALFQSVKFWPVGRSASGGVGLSGALTRSASSSGHMRAEATFLIKGEEGYLAWQGFVAQMNGVLGETLVPAWSRFMPKDINGRTLSRTEAVSVPKLGFADNTGLGQTDVVHASLASGASLRDGIISVNYDNTTGLRPGHRIGIGERCHDIMSVSAEENGTHTVRVYPLLREAYPNNQRIILDRPVCRMRFETEDQGYLPFTIAPVQSVTVSFREAV